MNKSTVGASSDTVTVYTYVGEFWESACDGERDEEDEKRRKAHISSCEDQPD